MGNTCGQVEDNCKTCDHKGNIELKFDNSFEQSNNENFQKKQYELVNQDSIIIPFTLDTQSEVFFGLQRIPDIVKTALVKSTQLAVYKGTFKEIGEQVYTASSKGIKLKFAYNFDQGEYLMIIKFHAELYTPPPQDEKEDLIANVVNQSKNSSPLKGAGGFAAITDMAKNQKNSITPEPEKKEDKKTMPSTPQIEDNNPTNTGHTQENQAKENSETNKSKNNETLTKIDPQDQPNAIQPSSPFIDAGGADDATNKYIDTEETQDYQFTFELSQFPKSYCTLGQQQQSLGHLYNVLQKIHFVRASYKYTVKHIKMNRNSNVVIPFSIKGGGGCEANIQIAFYPEKKNKVESSKIFIFEGKACEPKQKLGKLLLKQQYDGGHIDINEYLREGDYTLLIKLKYPIFDKTALKTNYELHCFMENDFSLDIYKDSVRAYHDFGGY